jgi:hypothetical protein
VLASGWPACKYAQGVNGVFQGPIHAYVIWYNSAAHPWTESAKRIVRAWLAGLNGSPYWTTFTQYITALGYNPPQIELKGECVDPENEGNFFNCPGANAAQAVVSGNVNGSGCNLPVDAAEYLILPSDTDVTLGGAGGCHALGTNVGVDFSSNIVLGNSVAGATTNVCHYGWVEVPGGQPTLNLTGFQGVDCQIWFLSHELAESITNWSAEGWFCGGDNSAEIADGCEGSAGTLTGYTYTAVTGSPASWGVTLDNIHYDFAAPPLVQLQPLSLCADQQIPASSIGISCAIPSDCLVTGLSNNQWQNNCSGGHCIAPTCSDGVVDGDEADIDCGGSCPNDQDSIAQHWWCASGKHCRSGSDCQSAICTAGVCN